MPKKIITEMTKSQIKFFYHANILMNKKTQLYFNNRSEFVNRLKYTIYNNHLQPLNTKKDLNIHEYIGNFDMYPKPCFIERIHRWHYKSY